MTQSDEAKARYRDANGRVVPGVTTIIGAGLSGDPEGLIHWAWEQGMKGLDYAEIRDTAANVGTVAHERIEAFMRNLEPDLHMYDDDLIDASNMPFESFLSWYTRSIVDYPMFSEEAWIHEDMKFGGRVDYVGYVDGSLTVLDYKTGKRVYAKTLAQVAAYAELLQHTTGYIAEQAKILHISREGAFEVINLTKQDLITGWDAFTKAFAVYRASQALEKALRAARKPNAISPLHIPDTMETRTT